MQSKIKAFFKSSSTNPKFSDPSSVSFNDDIEFPDKDSEITIKYSRRVRNPERSNYEQSLILDESNGEGSKEEELGLKKSGKVLNKKRSYAQLHLEMGQSDFLLRTCRTCGFKYAAGDEGDDKVHKSFHRNYTHGVPFKGWRSERVIAMPLPEGQRIILILDDDFLYRRNKVEEVFKMMEMELGDGWSFNKSFKAYLFVSSQRIAGCLLAEPIEKVYRIVSNSADMRLDNSMEKKAPQKSTVIQFGGVNFCREAARRPARDKAQKVPDEDLNGLILCKKESVPASCGVRAIWVAPSMRRKHIATHLLDAVRKSFRDDSTLERHQLAFSQPTSSGKALLLNYTGKNSFLVYTDL